MRLRIDIGQPHELIIGGLPVPRNYILQGDGWMQSNKRPENLMTSLDNCHFILEILHSKRYTNYEGNSNAASCLSQ